MDIRGKSFSFVIVTIMFVWQIFLDYFLILWTTCAVCVIAVPGHVGTVWEFPLHAAEHGGICETAADHRHSDHRLPRPRGCRLLLMPSSVHICNQCKSLLILLSLVRKLRYYFTLMTCVVNDYLNVSLNVLVKIWWTSQNRQEQQTVGKSAKGMPTLVVIATQSSPEFATMMNM